MQTGPEVKIERISFSDLHSFPELFSTYCENYPAVASFFSGNPFDDKDLLEAVERSTSSHRDVDTLADVLLEQNSRWGIDDATRASIESLRNGASVVITGQQLGLFGGPVYTQYKTITTIQLARHLGRISDRDVVPVFWLAGEDHDFEEVASIYLRPDKKIGLGSDAGTGPVGDRLVGEDIVSLLDETDETLANEHFGKEVVSQLREFYAAGSSWTDAFARYTSWLFKGTGLIIASGTDARLKKIGSPVFRKAASDFETLNASITETSRVLEESFHAQLKPRSTNLFYMTSGTRSPVDPVGDGFKAETFGEFGSEEFLNLIEDSPDLISPNVVTRPLYQDLLFPTVANVAGPGETSYFAQLKGAYDWAGIPMPVIYPRVSISILESNISRQMDKESIRLEEIDIDVERMFTDQVKDSLSPDIQNTFSSFRETLKSQVTRLANEVAEHDPTLRKSTLSISSSIEKEIDRVQAKLVRAQKQKAEVTRNRLSKIVASVYPDGAPQERRISAIYFLSRYGRDFISTLLDQTPMNTSSHCVIRATK